MVKRADADHDVVRPNLGLVDHALTACGTEATLDAPAPVGRRLVCPKFTAGDRKAHATYRKPNVESAAAGALAVAAMTDESPERLA
jgi:hypothetical protein